MSRYNVCLSVYTNEHVRAACRNRGWPQQAGSLIAQCDGSTGPPARKSYWPTARVRPTALVRIAPGIVVSPGAMGRGKGQGGVVWAFVSPGAVFSPLRSSCNAWNVVYSPRSCDAT